MTFEERIDRLTERHEALAQSLELMAIQTEANRKAIEEQSRSIEKQKRNIDTLVTLEREARKITMANSLGIADLLTVARAHEARIKNLEAA